MEDQLLRPFGILVGLHDLAGRGIERTDRLAHPQRHVDLVAAGDNRPRQLNRSGAEPLGVIRPRGDGPLPKEHTAEGVACDDRPSAGDTHVVGRSLVEDVEEPLAG